jgi:hypothetical protein
VDVVVTNPSSSATLLGRFTFTLPPPAITGVVPNSGPTTGETGVTITGSNFQAGASVAFGGAAATEVTVNRGGTAITAATPTEAAGAVNVEVTNPDSQSATLADAFNSVASSESAPYSARTDTDLQIESPLPARLNPPAVNVVFSDPDFGSRMVRVTDGNTPGQVAGRSWTTASDASVNEWSLPDSNGNYKFTVGSEGARALPMRFNPVTMQASVILPSPYVLSKFARLGIAWSFTDPNTIYGSGVGSDQFAFAKYVFSGNTAKYSRIFDTSNCPGVGALSGTTDQVAITKDDNRLMMAEGPGQNRWNYIVVYDQDQGTCRSWNTTTGVISGSMGSLNDPTGIAVSPLPAPSAPSLSTIPGGSLGSRTYYVTVDYVDLIADRVSNDTYLPLPAGQSAASSESTITVPAGYLLVVQSPSAAKNSTGNLTALGWNVFVAPSSGGETLQNGNGNLQASIAIGKNWTEPSSCSGDCYSGTNIVSTGASPPESDHSVAFGIHNSRESFDGKWIQANPSPGQWHAFWQTDTMNIVFCHDGSPLGCNIGHHVLGYEHWINNQNSQDDMQILIRKLSAPTLGMASYLVNPIGTPGIPASLAQEEGFDNHFSWNNDNSTDTAPICDAQYSGLGENGASGIVIKRAWDNEIICIATSAPPTVWRFAHHRSNATNGFHSIPIGQVSQDGKFLMFSSDWENTLGYEKGNPYRYDVFVVELK